MDEEQKKIFRAVAYGFALASIAGRTSVTNSDGAVNQHIRIEALAIVDGMMSLMPQDPA